MISAFYRLLNTRSKNGQILLDVMAGKGYFTQFWGQNEFKFFNGKSIPVFDTNKVIREVVYVETDLDTDHDGKSDLIQVTVFRPAETNKGLKVPALYTASPYFGGIIANENETTTLMKTCPMQVLGTTHNMNTLQSLRQKSQTAQATQQLKKQFTSHLTH